MRLSTRQVGVACAAITVTIWVSFIVVARAMAHASLTPFDIGFVRFLFAGVLLIPCGVWWVRRERRHSPSARSFAGIAPVPAGSAVLAGLFGGIGYSTLAYSGFFFAPASHAAVLMPGMLPLWTALVAWLLLATPVPPRRAFGLALILLAALLVGGPSLFGADAIAGAWRGDLLFLAASLSWSIYTVIARKHALAPIPATIALASFACLAYVPVYALAVAAGWVPSGLAQAPWRELLFQGVMQGWLSFVVSGITFVKMVEVFGPVRSTLITSAVPPLSALGAVIFLGEPMTGWLALALVLATIGISFGIRPVTPRVAPVAAKPS
ncbi:MAG: DMT family transporter [Casimicrobiaceae bacterium]